MGVCEWGCVGLYVCGCVTECVSHLDCEYVRSRATDPSSMPFCNMPVCIIPHGIVPHSTSFIPISTTPDPFINATEPLRKNVRAASCTSVISRFSLRLQAHAHTQEQTHTYTHLGVHAHGSRHQYQRIDLCVRIFHGHHQCAQ